MTVDHGKIRLTILLLWGAGILAAGQFAKIAVTFSYFREIYPGLGPRLGLLTSALSVMGVILGLMTGLLVARFGAKRILTGAMVLGGAVSLVQALLPGFAMMIVSRSIEGAAHLAIVVAAPTLIGQIAPPERRNLAMTLWSTVFAVAFAAFSWLGLPFVKAFGVPALFLLHGVAILGLALILSRILPPPTRQLEMAAPSLKDILDKHRTVYRSPWIAAPAAGWLFYAMGFVAIVTVLPDFFPEDQRGLLSGTLPLAALVVSMTAGVALLRRFSAEKIVIGGFVVCAALALTFIVIGPASWLAVALFGATGLIQGGSFTLLPALNRTVETQALANGALAQMGNLGNVIGTPVLLAMTGAFGFAGMIGFAVFAYLSGMGVHLWLAQRRKTTHPPA